jgi:hypothetical protein
MTFKKVLVLFVITVVVFITSAEAKKESKGKEPLVQMAILLDTSGSMEGLIEQAKTQLWKIVNQMALAKRKGKSPRLEVALYEYGKSTIPASEGYLRMIVPFSIDLDRISEELFKLRTNGGSEYCGKVIQSAYQELKWTGSNRELKMIFIAGNESFTQGHVNYKTACQESIKKGIMVNTIFCGNYNEGVRTFWKDGADLADGQYMNIDQNKKMVYISAPQDKEIIKLGGDLNKTYVAYGRGGGKLKERQKMQDKNALSVNEEVMVQRAATKSSKNYSNIAWDLVDAEKEGKIKLEELEEGELPAEMKKMDKKQRRAYLQKKKKERKKLQDKIKNLKKQRDKYVADKKRPWQ